MQHRLHQIFLLQPHVGYPVHPQRHDFHEMIVVLRGRYQAQSGTKSIELGSGNAVLYPAGVEHGVRKGHTEVTFYCLQWVGPDDLGDQAVIAQDPSQRLAMAARWLHDLHHRPTRDTVIETALLTALIGEVQVSVADAAQDAIESVRRVLDHNFDVRQSLPNLATMAGLSPSQLNRSFRKRFGCSVMGYLRQVRIEAALAMLTVRQVSVQEVAEACGFQRSSYLVRVIREHTGLTPGQIRSGLSLRGN